MLKSWLREPLLHFFLIGIGIFALYYGVVDPQENGDRNINLTTADVDQMVLLFQKTNLRAPTDAELEGLIKERIREEVLYREAVALGLDQDDIIVKRRLAQKATFLFEDLTEAADPGDEVLAAWAEENRELFVIPPAVSFLHSYFSVDRRGESAEQDARGVLQQFRVHNPDPQQISAAGDTFMFGYEFEGQSEAGISRMFGRDFAAALLKLAPGEWHGPVASGYGLHVVYVSKVTAEKMPEFAAIRDRVLMEWAAERQRDANERMYQALLDQYSVEVAEPSLDTIAGGVAR